MSMTTMQFLVLNRALQSELEPTTQMSIWGVLFWLVLAIALAAFLWAVFGESKGEEEWVDEDEVEEAKPQPTRGDYLYGWCDSCYRETTWVISVGNSFTGYYGKCTSCGDKGRVG